MIKLKNLFALMLAAVTALCCLAGCSGNSNWKPDGTAAPADTQTAANTSDPSATPDPNATATPVPEWMWTPDPALFILGEDGFYDDRYLSAYWPAYLEYQYSVSSNSAQYTGYPYEGAKKLAFSYTPDEGGIFEEECGGFDFDSYQKFIRDEMNMYFELQEFGYITIDGHRALRAVYNYNPPEEPEHFTRVLQYTIEVNGWILGLCFTTQADTFPEECVTCINTIHFKDGY